MMFTRMIAAAAAMVAVAGGASRAEAAGWGADYFPNVELVTHRGEELRFYDDLVEDRIVVINFVYTECPDICSLSTARLAQVADWLGERLGRDIFFLSITLDPANDTPEKLAEYARAFGEREGWLFLTGDPDDLDLLGYKLGERSDSLGEHRSDLVLGNAATGEWRRSSPMGSLSLLAREILEMDPDWRPTRRPDAAPESVAMSPRRGEALFLQGCASCHSIGDGIRVGPDLAGVTLRRDPEWLARFIMAPDVLWGNGDPVAVALDAAFPGVSMPNLRLGRNDAEDLISYLEAESHRLDAEAESEAAALRAAEHAHGPGHTHGSDEPGEHQHRHERPSH